MTETNIRTQHANIHDPLEVRIRELIRNQVEKNTFGVSAIQEARRVQLDYFLDNLKNPNSSAVYENTQLTLKELARVTNAKLVEGAEMLTKIPRGTSVMLVMNHFGINKLTTFRPEEVGLSGESLQVAEIYPFTMYFAAAVPIANALGRELVEAHLKMPGQELADLQANAGLLVIPPDKGAFEEIKERTRDLFKKRPGSVLTIFPEGVTSGKRSKRGPYNLEPFHSGAWGIVTELAKDGMPVYVVSAYQYWNPESGFEVGIVKVDAPDGNTSREEQKALAVASMGKMQAALDLKSKP